MCTTVTAGKTKGRAYTCSYCGRTFSGNMMFELGDLDLCSQCLDTVGDCEVREIDLENEHNFKRRGGDRLYEYR